MNMINKNIKLPVPAASNSLIVATPVNGNAQIHKMDGHKTPQVLQPQHPARNTPRTFIPTSVKGSIGCNTQKQP